MVSARSAPRAVASRSCSMIWPCWPAAGGLHPRYNGSHLLHLGVHHRRQMREPLIGGALPAFSGDGLLMHLRQRFAHRRLEAGAGDGGASTRRQKPDKAACRRNDRCCQPDIYTFQRHDGDATNRHSADMGCCDEAPA